MTVRRLGPLIRRLLRAPARLYDWNAGWLLGERFLLLTHVGRRSGREYRTMLEVVGHGPAKGELTVLAGLGRSANWYRNLQARPTAEVAISRRRFTATHRTLSEDEAVVALAGYERRNRVVAPVVRLVLGRLAGFHYDGTDAARHRLVRELPVVALRPVGHA